ncbi:transglycosylase SLT domain-containing protein [Pseudomonas sp. NY11226]|uniref:transglycosylase SLT domain-containing protein n=1 Tax=Pseudomonas sp. NY11226 TaxID=3400362 RepID=UPI003A8B51A1
MANKFDIVIGATDKATAVFRKVNNEAGRLVRPFQETGNSFKRLGRELGFQRIGQDLRNMGRTATSTASSVASVVAPMAALTGVGSIAGVAALADHWSRLGRATSNAAGNIGVSTQELQAFQGMGQLAGMSADQAAGSLQGLANTMQNAQWGRDNGALMLMNRLGVGIKHTASGAIDASGQFMALATAISKIKNPQAQMVAAGKFGMTEWLPLIRQGPQAMRELQKRAESLGLVMSGSAMRSATDFANSLDNLQGAGLGLKNSVMEQLTPAIKPLTDGLANWIVQNRELIATDVGAWARDFAQWVQSIDWKGVGDDIHGFVDGVHDVVGALGGWKNAALLTIGVMNAGLIGSVLGLTATLARGGLGVAAFVGLLFKWTRAAKAAKVATLEAAAAEELLGQGGKGGKRGVNTTGLGLAGLALTATQLSGDQSDSSRDAQTLQFEALSGNQDAAKQLATIQLTHWWKKAPTPAEIDARAKDISSGREAGMTPDQVAARYPQRAAAEQRLTQLEGQYGLPSGLLDAIWKQESSRGRNMVSPAGAEGHFGFMPETSKAYHLANPMDFNQSSDASARMFRDLLKQYNGDTTKALAAYNWGSGNLAKKGLDAAPAETRNYIRDVTAALAAHQATGKDVPTVAPEIQPPAAPTLVASAPDVKLPAPVPPVVPDVKSPAPVPSVVPDVKSPVSPAVAPVAVEVKSPTSPAVASAAPVQDSKPTVQVVTPPVTVKPVVPPAPRDANQVAQGKPSADQDAPKSAQAAQVAQAAPAAPQAAPAGPAPAAAPQTAPSGPYSAPKQATEQTLKHEFELTFHGLPAGVTPVAKSRSGAPVTGRIGYSALEGIA